MALSHNERKEAVLAAKKKNIVDVAQSLGMDLKKHGRNFIWAEHDSFVINTKKNLYYWNAMQQGGDPIHLVKLIKECSFKEAVAYLNDTDLKTMDVLPEGKKKPFHYYMKEHKTMQATTDYLVKERKLSKETVDFFVSEGLIAQSTYKDKESGKTESAIVFKHKDLNGTIKGISLQGMWKNEEIHGERGYLKKTYGDGYYGMNIRVGSPPSVNEATKEHPLRIIAFESPIDLMSYYELFKDTLGDSILLSMNGLRKETISTYLANEVGARIEDEKKHEYLDKLSKNNLFTDKIEVVLAVDNDAPHEKTGIRAAQRFVEEFPSKSVIVKADIPELLAGQTKNDWNEVLKLSKKEELKIPPKEEQIEKWLNLSREDQNEILIVMKENPVNFNLVLQKYGLEDVENVFTGLNSPLHNELLKRYNTELLEGVNEFSAERREWLDQGFPDHTMFIPKKLWKVADKFGMMENYPRVEDPVNKEEEKSRVIEWLSRDEKAKEGNNMSENETAVETTQVPQVGSYLVVEFNETNLELGVKSYQGEIVTPGLIETIKQLDRQLEQKGLYYKFYFDEISDGQTVNHVRMNVGDGLENNSDLYEFLENGAAQKQKEESLGNDIEEKKVVIEEKQNTQSISAVKQQLQAKLQKNNSDYLSEFKQALDETFGLMETKEEGTVEYISKSELDAILGEHLTRIEQVVASYSTSYGLLEKPTEAQKATLVQGLIETIAAAFKQFKSDLTQAMTAKKNAALYNVKDKTNHLRLATKNSFNSRILKVNESIKGLVDKIDVTFALEEKIVQSDPPKEIEAVEETSNTQEGVVEKNQEPTSEVLLEEETLVDLVREYIKLVEENEKLSATIKQEIAKSPLTSLEELQKELMEIQKNKKEIEEKIQAKTPNKTEENLVEKAALVSGLAELVKQKDQLTIEREAVANEASFLRSSPSEMEKGSPLKRFQLLDKQILAIDEKIKLVEAGETTSLDQEKVEVELPKLDPSDPFVLATNPVAKESNLNQVEPMSTIKSAVETKNMEKLSEELNNGLKDYLQVDAFKKYLKAAGEFHTYSPKNVQLILNQKPEALQVASDTKWANMGYSLKENAEPIYVYAPKFNEVLDNQGQPVLNEKGEVKKDVEFYLKPVYDVSQVVDGKVSRTEIPLETPEQFRAVFQGLSEATKAKVSIESMAGIEKSTYLSSENEIVIAPGLGKEETIKTLIEEITRLSINENPKLHPHDEHKEFLVESTATIVSSRLGLDTNNYTLNYLSDYGQNYSKDTQRLKLFSGSLDYISKQASGMIEKVEQSVTKNQALSTPKNRFDERLEKAKMDSEQLVRSQPQEQKERSSSVRI